MPSIRVPKVVFLITFGIFVHALIFKAAIDIHFSSPIDNGMTPIKSTDDPPANRLVLIVADGLRAEAIFHENGDSVAPNLNKIRRSRGSWGISHTRVPTESRPGHVALLGGIYEDPSAILKGWKVNPVDFDSVINQSTNAWCWGGPSIINMFNKDNSPHIRLYSYDHKMEDFGNNNTIGLDLWVFDEVNEFMQERALCSNCSFSSCSECGEFEEHGNLFFLHLLGTDTAGHAFKPESEGYKNNIKFVDDNIPKIENLFENMFKDARTAYVFTADHGMTNWGSHGAGSDHETKTPLIAWGAGIKVENTQKDVQQIDIAPLLSALIGINYPINSHGRLPVDYINSSLLNVAEMQISNALQLMEIFKIKMFRTMTNALVFEPYKHMTLEKVNEKVKLLRHLAGTFQTDLLNFEVNTLMTFLIKGAEYYHYYYKVPLLISITCGFALWMIYLITSGIELDSYLIDTPFLYSFYSFVFLPLYVIAVIFVYLQKLPLMYYLYLMFPLIMLHIITSRYRHVLEALKRVKKFGTERALVQAVVYIFGLRLLVQGFRDRESLSAAMCLLAGFIWTDPLDIHITRGLKFKWMFCCLCVAIFPFAPVMQTTFNTVLYLLGFVLWWKGFQLYILPQLDKSSENVFIRIQFYMFKLTPIYVIAVELNYVESESPLKYLALIWSLIPAVLIPFTPIYIYSRLTSIFLAFGTYYLMLSSTYEVLFITCYIFLLYCWLTIESKSFGYTSLRRVCFHPRVETDQEQTNEDYRRAFFFVVLIFMGFFGTGNIASLNSFDPMWVRCFLTVFSPFKMTALILLKIIIPFLFTTCLYRAVNLLRQGNILNMFCIVLTFSDVMLLELLFCITNVGSWLEIGTSLSQFIIMQAFVLILLLLYGISYMLTAFHLL